MKSIFLFHLAFLLTTCTCCTQNPGNAPDRAALQTDLTRRYCQAVAEYIKAVYNQNNPAPDTLFLGKSPEYPDMALPARISNVPVKLISAEAAKTYLAGRTSWIYLNVIGWREDTDPEFLIVTFFEGWKPQHNCHLNFSHRNENGEYQLDSLKFEYPYPNTGKK